MLVGVAAVIAACAALVTAIGSLTATRRLLQPILQSAKHTERVVNQERSDRAAFQAILIEKIQRHGLVVPDDPSVSGPQTAPESGR